MKYEICNFILPKGETTIEVFSLDPITRNLLMRFDDQLLGDFSEPIYFNLSDRGTGKTLAVSLAAIGTALNNFNQNIVIFDGISTKPSMEKIKNILTLNNVPYNIRSGCTINIPESGSRIEFYARFNISKLKGKTINTIFVDNANVSFSISELASIVRYGIENSHYGSKVICVDSIIPGFNNMEFLAHANSRFIKYMKNENYRLDSKIFIDSYENYYLLHKKRSEGNV